MKKRNISVIFQNHDDERLFLESGIVDKSKICFIKGSGVDLSEYNFFRGAVRDAIGGDIHGKDAS